MDLSLDLLRTFLAVYRAGSVTGGARRLSLSQPTVTAQLRALETALGRPLFTRLPRGVAPTPAADLLARRVSEPLDTLAGLIVDEVDESAVVHLGGPTEFLTSVVLPAAAPLIARGLRLRVSFGLPAELTGLLRDGSIDLALLSVRPRGGGLRVEPLCDEEFLLVGAPSVAGADLSEVPLIAYAEDLPIVRRYWQTEFGVRPARDAAVVVPNLHAVLATVLAGGGYSVLPEYLCAADLAAGRLVRLHEPAVVPLNTVYLAERAGEPPSPARERLVSALRSAVRPDPR
ncbi:LysR family transcriptional regulator [Paractinoplanes deccanensis]|uniref:LysR family transcriptional regulator n=1 Tax=Paractinoplanes deccanensis TaxID=113561 RepID=A0ABQ3YM14_9ACTN|nr:LysR family transcriptional regulator [Actinoplanes deccanensis]GID81046.1 LysR family transcriptional regulator [Actinoplanes deccanensis]